ncbi:MAG: sporulation protein YtfJ [Firmicutes bacterium]|nr:sporulation protein YtfJ [Bacillota bacterium]
MANPVTEMLESAMKNVKGMVDVNSVIGKAVRVDTDTVVIPIAKVSCAFGGGGADMVSKHKNDEKNFSGGIGGGTTVKAEAFLVISKGNVRIVPVNVNASSVDKLIDLVPEMVDKVSGLFAKKDSGAQDSAEDVGADYEAEL